MPRGVPTTPEQEAIISQVWHETANASEAARAAGLTEHAARNVLARLKEAKRGDLHTHALAKGERKARRAASAAIDSLLADLQDGDGMIRVQAARALADMLRSLNSVRVADAKLRGDHAPEKHALNVAAEVVVLPALESHGSPAAQGAVDAEPGSAD